jgi:hypothetical protein
VFDVLLANGLVLLAGADVVVALGQPKSGLVNVSDLFAGVLEVLLLAEAEEDVDAAVGRMPGQRGIMPTKRMVSDSTITMRGCRMG